MRKSEQAGPIALPNGLKAWMETQGPKVWHAFARGVGHDRFENQVILHHFKSAHSLDGFHRACPVLWVNDGVAFFEFLHACYSSKGSVQAKA